MTKSNGQDSLPSLHQTLLALQDPERPIDSIRLDVLSDLNSAEQDRFRATWATLAPPRRRLLVTAMVELSENQVDAYFNEIYRWLIQDEDAYVRAAAIEGLWEDENVRLIAPLIRLLESDRASEVRAAAALSLGRFLLLGELGQIDATLSERVERALLEAFAAHEHDVSVRRRALESLAYSSSDALHPLILNSYEDEDESMRISAIFAMGRSADSRWRDHVLAELVSSDNAMRFEAARASGELELAEAVPDLIDLLDEDDVDLRDSAVWALGRIGGPAARRALEACCMATDEGLREAAEEALAELEFLAGDVDLPAFFFEP